MVSSKASFKHWAPLKLTQRLMKTLMEIEVKKTVRGPLSQRWGMNNPDCVIILQHIKMQYKYVVLSCFWIHTSLMLPEDILHWFLSLQASQYPMSLTDVTDTNPPVTLWDIKCNDVLQHRKSRGKKLEISKNEWKCKRLNKSFLWKQMKSPLCKRSKQTWLMEAYDSCPTTKKQSDTKLASEVWSSTFLFIKWLV